MGIAIPKDSNGNPLYTYRKIKYWVNEKENYKYHFLGNPTFMPDQVEGKPIPVGSVFRSWFTNKEWYYRNDGWHPVGDTDPVIVDLATPIDELIANTSVDYTISDSGATEKRQIGDKMYTLPIFSAENADAIYEHDVKNANLQIALKNAASTYNFNILVDGEEVEDLSFDVDLTQRVEIILEQKDVPSGDTDLTYGVILYVDTTATPDPTPTIESGSLVSDEETPTISNFTIESGIIKINPQSAVDANWRVNGITYFPEWDNIKLYLGEKETEELNYNYRPYVPGETITQENDKYAFMPVYNGAEPSEDEFNVYPIEFAASNKKGRKK